MRVLVSACLLGENCKYNGGNNFTPAVAEYLRGKDVLPVCPELLAGLGCPRVPMEIVDGVLMTRDGRNVDAVTRGCGTGAGAAARGENRMCGFAV